MSDCTATVIESQADWLTFAAHTHAHQTRLNAHVPLWLDAESQAGNRTRPFRLLGFEGHQCGRVRAGYSERGVLVQLSGDFADRYLSTALDVADSLTRIDLAVTARLPDPTRLLALEHYAECLDWHSGKPGRAEPTLLQRGAHSATLYVGQRASAFYLRVYNKHQESIDNGDDAAAERYRHCWRYELEVKGPDASLLARQLEPVPDRPGYVQRWVHDWSTRHGLTPAFPQGGGQALQPGFRRRSDAYSRLQWIERRVAPSMQWLIAHGYQEQLRKLLPPDLQDPDGESTP